LSDVVYDPYRWETAHDPYPIYRRLRDEAPVYRNEELGFWALSRHADVLAAHNDPATFVSSGGVTIEGKEKGSPLLLLMDQPEHTWHRKIVSRVFTPRRVADLEPFVRARAGELLDKFRDAAEFDAVTDLSVQLPLDVISELVGIPEELRATVHELSDKVLARSSDGEISDEVVTATIGLVVLFLDLVKDRRAHPRDDVITLLIQTEVTDDDGITRRLSDEEVAVRFQELALAGHETVAKLIPNGLVALTWFPDQRRLLLEDPSLMRRAVDEMLRWDAPSQYQGRTANRDVELHGVTVRAGDRVILLTGSANHDERVYADPDRFDVRREIDHPVSFGFGIHLCLGAHLARLETRVAFEEILARFPDFAVDGDRAVRHAHSNVRGLSHLPVLVGGAA
jgi:cytochrome P450